MHNPPHPGELVATLLIRDEDGNNIESVEKVASRLGCHRNTLNKLITCKQALSPKMALALETDGRGSAEHWLAMQAAYDLFQLRNNQAA
jgi:addiction module HigA family antidote